MIDAHSGPMMPPQSSYEGQARLGHFVSDEVIKIWSSNTIQKDQGLGQFVHLQFGFDLHENEAAAIFKIFLGR